MKLYVLPPSPRALKVIALKNHLGLDCEMQVVDLGKDEHRTAKFTTLNPNQKMPVLVDEGFVLWE
jgi:glutathione S-transferase